MTSCITKVFFNFDEIFSVGIARSEMGSAWFTAFHTHLGFSSSKMPTDPNAKLDSEYFKQ